MNLVKPPWSRGPTMKFIDGTRRYDVTYRYRLPGEVQWIDGKIGITARRRKDAEERVIRFLSSKWRAEVEIKRIAMVSDEMPIQSGDPVETVSEKEYLERRDKMLEATEEERKERLRARGLWIP